jgi:hypothetical protein
LDTEYTEITGPFRKERKTIRPVCDVRVQKKQSGNVLAQPERSVYNTRNTLTKAMMGTSKPVHAGSEPGRGESRVSQMG